MYFISVVLVENLSPFDVTFSTIDVRRIKVLVTLENLTIIIILLQKVDSHKQQNLNVYLLFLSARMEGHPCIMPHSVDAAQELKPFYKMVTFACIASLFTRFTSIRVATVREKLGEKIFFKGHRKFHQRGI